MRYPARPSLQLHLICGLAETSQFHGMHHTLLLLKANQTHMLFFQEVLPPHTAEYIRIYFEDALDHCHIKCYYIVTDNSANMKCAFNRSGVVDELDTSPSVDHGELPSDDEEYDNGSDFDGLGHGTPATPWQLQY